MAGIDHTILWFKNAEYAGNYEYEVKSEDIPFEYNRDGAITGIKDVENAVIITPKRHVECPCINMFDEILFEMLRKKSSWQFRSFLEDNLTEYDYYEDTKYLLLVVRTSSFNASFFKDSTDTYVLLGGYGHYQNPYTHFERRGMCEEFCEEMHKEAYDFLVNNVLERNFNTDMPPFNEYKISKSISELQSIFDPEHKYTSDCVDYIANSFRTIVFVNGKFVEGNALEWLKKEDLFVMGNDGKLIYARDHSSRSEIMLSKVPEKEPILSKLAISILRKDPEYARSFRKCVDDGTYYGFSSDRKTIIIGCIDKDERSFFYYDGEKTIATYTNNKYVDNYLKVIGDVDAYGIKCRDKMCDEIYEYISEGVLDDCIKTICRMFDKYNFDDGMRSLLRKRLKNAFDKRLVEVKDRVGG